MTWSESVDVALCFGWIDSKHIKIDEEKSRQYFSKRKPKSTWSKINKNKVEVLISSGLMMEAGLRSIEIAKENGSWTILDEVEELVVPADLESAFAEAPTAHQFYLTLSKSWKKAILYWIVSAKQPETRTRRITEIIDRGNENLKPKQFQ